jgi:hypothetical protein
MAEHASIMSSYLRLVVKQALRVASFHRTGCSLAREGSREDRLRNPGPGNGMGQARGITAQYSRIVD